jgi:hypothetical protein
MTEDWGAKVFVPIDEEAMAADYREKRRNVIRARAEYQREMFKFFGSITLALAGCAIAIWQVVDPWFTGIFIPLAVVLFIPFFVYAQGGTLDNS